MGARTAVHQAALGCRYQCEFCGVVSMWNGKTVLRGARRACGWRSACCATAGAPTRCSSTTTTSSTARRRACRCWTRSRGCRCPGGATRAPTPWPASRATWEQIRKQPPAHGLHRRGGGQRRGAEADAEGCARRAHAGGRPSLPRVRRHPRALVRAGRPGRSGGRDREDLRVHPPDQGASPRVRDRPLLLQPDAAARSRRRADARRGARACRCCAATARRARRCRPRPRNGREPRWVELRLPPGRALARPRASAGG